MVVISTAGTNFSVDVVLQSIVEGVSGHIPGVEGAPLPKNTKYVVACQVPNNEWQSAASFNQCQSGAMLDFVRYLLSRDGEVAMYDVPGACQEVYARVCHAEGTLQQSLDPNNTCAHCGEVMAPLGAHKKAISTDSSSYCEFCVLRGLGLLAQKSGEASP